MKKLISIIGCLVCLSAVAQKQIPLDTAPVGAEKIVILPTYNNLLKLSAIDSSQMDTFLQKYSYTHEGTAGGFSSEGDDFDVYKGNKEVDIMLGIKTDYFGALRDDVKKRFPNLVPATKDAHGETYLIPWSDVKGQHIQQLRITEDTVSGGVSLTILK